MGLTPNQAKTYIALVKSGNSTVREIAKITELARETVYRTIPALESMGIVERRLTDPITFKAVEPKNVVTLLFNRQMLKNREIKKKMYELAKELEMGSFLTCDDSQEKDKPILTLLTGHESFSRLLIASLSKAQKSFDGITTPQYFRIEMLEAAKPFKDAVFRGVKFRHIITKTEPDLENVGDNSLRKNGLWQVRCSFNSQLIDCVIIDDKEAFIAVSSLGKNASYLHSTATNIVAMAQHYFEARWQELKPQQIHREKINLIVSRQDLIT